MSESRSTPNAFVFIHIPKTAGTAFRVAARKVLGDHALHRHYKKSNPETSELIRQTVMLGRPDRFAETFLDDREQLLCGHFFAKEYISTLRQQVRWCTIIRNPVDRVLSEYAHLLRKSENPNQRRKALPLEAFIEQPGQINKQHRMLDGLTKNEFAWIGESENFAASIATFNQQFNLAFPTPRVNIGDWSLLKGAHENQAMRERIAKLNSLDMTLVDELRTHPSVVAARNLLFTAQH